MSDKLRVNLQFGARAERDLFDALRSLPPYRRAKLARQLISEAWRARSVPGAQINSHKTSSATPPLLSRRAPKAFEDDLLSGLGMVVKL